MSNWKRVKAGTLQHGDTLVMWDELTGDPRAVDLTGRHTYTNGTVEWSTGSDGLRLIFSSPQQEVCRMLRRGEE